MFTREVMMVDDKVSKILDEKPTPNPLAKKLFKILDTKLENNEETMDALKELSTFFEENTLTSRRNLRGQIEKRSVTINEDFVHAMKDVKNAIDIIHQEVASMSLECEEMRQRVQNTKSETRHLIQQTNSLQSHSHKIQTQEKIVRSFTNAFQLNQEEILALQGKSKTDTIKPNFFAAWEKTHTICRNSKYLLQTGHQKTASDIVNQMNMLQEVALNRLFSWFKSNARSPEPSPLMSEALAVFQDRKSNFDLLVEEWIVVHRGWLTKGFLDALTIGGPAGGQRPIELQAHDALRYIGDMLAWVHQALPAEKEFAQTLFSKCTSLDIEELTLSTVSSISESICKPLKSRIEQVVISEQSRDHVGGKKALTLYKISSLLKFYKATILQVTGNSVLVCTLGELHHLSHKMFLSALQNQVTQVCDRVEPPGESLVPSDGVARTSALLTEIVTAATVTDDSQQNFVQIIDCVVDPLVNAIMESGSNLGTSESAIYLLNCLHQLHSTLSLLHTTSQKLEKIQGQIDAQLDTLSQEQIRSVYQTLGLTSIYPVVMGSHIPTPLSQHPSCQAASLKAFAATLDSFLSAPDHLMLPHTKLLLSSSFRRQLQTRTSKAIVAVYTKLHSLTTNPLHQYPPSILTKSPEVVHSLLL